jgi:hypothetical protein
MARPHQQHDVEERFEIMPIQVSGTRSLEQFLCHIGRSACALLRGPGIAIDQVLLPRRKVVVGQHPVDFLLLISLRRSSPG